METEVRFYYSLESEDKLINKLKSFDSLKYDDTYYEKTDQYNHPMKEYDFYTKEVDGRLRVRKTECDSNSKCILSWKRRLTSDSNKIHQEEERELNIDIDEYDNLLFILSNVLHLELVESYERYRSRFFNSDVEIVVDRYPFGIAVEVEAKCIDKDPISVIHDWLNKLELDIDDAYELSWDDKYADLCKEQHKTIESIVRFDKDMPKILNDYK